MATFNDLDNPDKILLIVLVIAGVILIITQVLKLHGFQAHILTQNSFDI